MIFAREISNLVNSLSKSQSQSMSDIAEVYIKRSAIITKGEKGREMWHIFFVF